MGCLLDTFNLQQYFASLFNDGFTNRGDVCQVLAAAGENLDAKLIFEQAYLRRLSTMYERSKEAQSLEKRRMLIRFKKFLIRSRILTFMNEDAARLER